LKGDWRAYALRQWLEDAMPAAPGHPPATRRTAPDARTLRRLLDMALDASAPRRQDFPGGVRISRQGDFLIRRP